jgi:hypothetical protein
VTPDGFRKLVLALPDVHELSHLSHPDFRVGKRVLATLAYPDDSWGMVKLTPAQQARFVVRQPTVFVPVKGAWGAQGSTNVKLRAATRAILWPALVEGWRNLAPAAVKAQHPDLDMSL